MESYVGSRPSSDTPAGFSLFIALTFTCQQPPRMIGTQMVTPKQIYRQTHAIVASVINQGRLNVKFFDEQDEAALITALVDNNDKANFDLVKITPFVNEPALHGQLTALICEYIKNQRIAPLAFPTVQFGINPNCWMQSLVEYCDGALSRSMKGFDIANQLRLPRSYFLPYVKPQEHTEID